MEIKKIKLLQEFIDGDYNFFCNYLKHHGFEKNVETLIEFKLVEALEINRGYLVMIEDAPISAFNPVTEDYHGKMGLLEKTPEKHFLACPPWHEYKLWKKQIALTAIKLLENIKD